MKKPLESISEFRSHADGPDFIKEIGPGDYARTERLWTSAHLQRRFAVLDSGLLVPSIRSSSFDFVNGSGFIRMKRIDGDHPWVSLSAAEKALDATIAYLRWAKSQSVPTTINSTPIRGKLVEIEEKMTAANEHEIAASVRRLHATVPERLAMLLGPCHGDLTTGNILVTPTDRVFTFDFTPSPVDSVQLDAMKLKQDLVSRFYEAREIGPFDYPDVQVDDKLARDFETIRMRWIEEINNVMNDSETRYYNETLMRFQLMRTAPYVLAHPKLKQWFLTCIRSF